MLRAAPAMLEAGAHLFAISADPMALVQKIAGENDPGFFLLSDADKKIAARFGARGKLVGFVFGPDQKCRTVRRHADRRTSGR